MSLRRAGRALSMITIFFVIVALAMSIIAYVLTKDRRHFVETAILITALLLSLKMKI
ncbi:MAG: hypothetical protein QW039_01335 [Fervidicoccaceae archaeon]